MLEKFSSTKCPLDIIVYVSASNNFVLGIWELFSTASGLPVLLGLVLINFAICLVTGLAKNSPKFVFSVLIAEGLFFALTATIMTALAVSGVIYFGLLEECHLVMCVTGFLIISIFLWLSYKGKNERTRLMPKGSGPVMVV